MKELYPVSEWKTFCSNIPEQSRGKYHIVKRIIHKGDILPMKVLGHEDCIFLQDTVITILREGKKEGMDTDSVWMSDAPMEYFSAWELVCRTKGERILVGGLGLGLVVHLLSLREDIKEIVVVEICKEIIDMVSPYLPKKAKVIHGDFLKVTRELSEKGEHFDSVIADLWKTSWKEEDKILKQDSVMAMEDWYPDSTHLFWGFQGSEENEISELFFLHEGVRCKKCGKTFERGIRNYLCPPCSRGWKAFAKKPQFTSKIIEAMLRGEDLFEKWLKGEI